MLRSLYSSSPALFAAVTVAAVLALGLLLAGAGSLVMARIGIDLKPRKASEH